MEEGGGTASKLDDHSPRDAGQESWQFEMDPSARVQGWTRVALITSLGGWWFDIASARFVLDSCLSPSVAAATAGDMVCEGLPSERVGSWKREKGFARHRCWHHLCPSRRRR